MKKLVFILMIMLSINAFVACDNNTTEETEDIYGIDREKACSPSDRNCNGIPDSQE